MKRDLLDMPDRMQGRPIDHRGFPVPWFVTRTTPEGLHDFQRVDASRKDEALRLRKCWVSGEPLGRLSAFVLGPMCIVNRIASDPPVIAEIGEWSARICPFLSRPLAHRPSERPSDDVTPGVPVDSNPGLCAVWVTKSFVVQRDGLIRVGDPERVSWWREGREVTGSPEAQLVFERRVATLASLAAAEGEEALTAFLTQLDRARPFMPLGRTLAEVLESVATVWGGGRA